MFIRTERLFLRPGWPEDIDDLVEAMGDDAYARAAGFPSAPQSQADWRDYLDHGHEGALPHLFICLREDEGAKLIGGIGLGRAGQDVELSYWIARRHRGRGYAAEAVRAVLAEARMLGHRQVIATHFEDNDASARVLEQSGFRPTSEVRSRFSAVRGVTAPARLYVAVLADKLFDILGVGPQRALA